MILLVKAPPKFEKTKKIVQTTQFTPKRIGLVEAFLMLFIAVILDLINIIIIFIGLDDFFILELISFPLYGLWFHFKGGQWTHSLRGSIIEAVPYLGWLPFYTFFVYRAIKFTNHPEKTDFLSKVVSKGKGSFKKAATD